MRTRFFRIFPVFMGCLICFLTLSAAEGVGESKVPALHPIPERDCMMNCHDKYDECFDKCQAVRPPLRECERTCLHKLAHCVAGCPPPS